MAYTEAELAKELKDKKYEFGFVSNFESDKAPIGLSEDIIRLISAKKNEPEWMLEYRLKAYKVWQEMTEPTWAHIHYPKVDFQDIYYYSAPKTKKKLKKL